MSNSSEGRASPHDVLETLFARKVGAFVNKPINQVIFLPLPPVSHVGVRPYRWVWPGVCVAADTACMLYVCMMGFLWRGFVTQDAPPGRAENCSGISQAPHRSGRLGTAECARARRVVAPA